MWATDDLESVFARLNLLEVPPCVTPENYIDAGPLKVRRSLWGNKLPVHGNIDIRELAFPRPSCHPRPFPTSFPRFLFVATCALHLSRPFRSAQPSPSLNFLCANECFGESQGSLPLLIRATVNGLLLFGVATSTLLAKYSQYPLCQFQSPGPVSTCASPRRWASCNLSSRPSSSSSRAYSRMDRLAMRRRSH